METNIINKVRIIIRNMENSESIDDCSYFDLFISSLNLKVTTPLTTDFLMNISDSIFYDSEYIRQIKQITSNYSLNYDRVPQLWISKINDIDIGVVLKYYFDGDSSVSEELNALFELESDDDLTSYFENCPHSLEGLGS